MNRKIKNIFILLVIVAIIFIMSFNRLVDSLQKELDKPKQAVGMKVIFETDTLTIVDYSTLNSTFTLSNGKIISFEYANKNIIQNDTSKNSR